MPNSLKRTIHDIDNDENNAQIKHQKYEIEITRNQDNVKTKKKSCLNVKFDAVNVYYFDRQQGFTCIPSTGSNTIGMSFNHSHHEKYTLEEYLNYKRKIHLNILDKDKLNKKVLLRNIKHSKKTEVKSDDEIENDNIDLKNNELLLDVNYDLPINNELFCPILSPAERTRLIKINSDYGIDDSESREISHIRKSREQCGCRCKNTCEKETCLCIINGIGCQLDKTRFPCACSIRRCKNPYGTKRFDQVSVRKHYDYILYPEYYKETYENIDNKRRKTENNNEDNDTFNDENNKIFNKKRGRKSKRKQSSNTKTTTKPKILIENINKKTFNIEDNSNIVNNLCLDLLPYEPFDLFKFVDKFNNNLQEISV